MGTKTMVMVMDRGGKEGKGFCRCRNYVFVARCLAPLPRCFSRLSSLSSAKCKFHTSPVPALLRALRSPGFWRSCYRSSVKMGSAVSGAVRWGLLFARQEVRRRGSGAMKAFLRYFGNSNKPLLLKRIAIQAWTLSN